MSWLGLLGVRRMRCTPVASYSHIAPISADYRNAEIAYLTRENRELREEIDWLRYCPEQHHYKQEVARLNAELEKHRRPKSKVPITIEIVDGASIEDACREACECANITGNVIRFRFCNTDCEAHPYGSPAELVASYNACHVRNLATNKPL